jgi:Flp pilus assembly protein TadG
MVEMISSNEKKSRSARAQAIVEFAIALPVLLLLLLGIFEVGRYMFIYSSVTNASRNAVRYASAVGKNDSGLTKYNYCEGIKQVGLKSAYLVSPGDFTIDIIYDDGPGTSQFAECNLWNASQVDPDVEVSSGDRVTVTVTAQYRPILKLIPLTARPIISRSSRTILGIVQLQP